MCDELHEMEKAAIVDAMERHNGKQKDVAEELQIGLRTLYEKLRTYAAETGVDPKSYILKFKKEPGDGRR